MNPDIQQQTDAIVNALSDDIGQLTLTVMILGVVIVALLLIIALRKRR